LFLRVCCVFVAAMATNAVPYRAGDRHVSAEQVHVQRDVMSYLGMSALGAREWVAPDRAPY
jgi:hypothetical protein